MTWTDLRELGIRGRGWENTAHPYDRLPAHAEGVVTEAVWNLSRQSAGFYVDFRSDATALHVRTILRVPPHEHQSYIKYLDLYARDPAGAWRWAGMNQFGFIPSGQTPLREALPADWRAWRLYLPSFYVVERMELGLPAGAALEPAPMPGERPIVVYGTSIVHGHAASRPGMTWPSILGRRLERPVINLGFSGSARMEPDLGKIIAELDPALFVIDPLPNMNREGVERNAGPFLRFIRDAHPGTPVLLVEDRTHAQEWLYPAMRKDREAKRSAFRAVFDKLRADASGARWGYVEGDPLLGEDGEATADGSHPSGLGFVRYADRLQPVVADLLRKG